MHCEHSHRAQNAMGMRVAFTPTSASGSCLFGLGLAAPSSRGWCALWRVLGRDARTGGRAGRACWLPVTSRRHGSGCSGCYELMKGHYALLECKLWCCSLNAPTHACDFAHAASVPGVWRLWGGRWDIWDCVQHAVCCVLLCFVA